MDDLILGLFIWIFTSSPFIIGGIAFYLIKSQKAKDKIKFLESENKDLSKAKNDLENKIKSLEIVNEELIKANKSSDDKIRLLELDKNNLSDVNISLKNEISELHKNNHLGDATTQQPDSSFAFLDKTDQAAENISEVKERILNKFQNKSDRTKQIIKAAIIVVEAQECRSSIIQNKLLIGVNRAADIIDFLEEIKVVGRFKGASFRDVLIPNLNSLETHLNTIDNNIIPNNSTLPISQNVTSDLFIPEYFIKIEVDKKVIELNPKMEKFILNDDNLIDDLVYFIMNDGTTNRVGGKFNIPYNPLQIIFRDLKILKLIEEHPSAYGYISKFKSRSEYEQYKTEYKLFKDNIDLYKERINAEAINKFNEIKAQAERWEVLEEERKKEEIRLKLLNQNKQKELQKKVKHEMIEEGLLPSMNLRRRERISQEVKDAVWNRDGGKCVECGSKERIEFDHIVPFSKGGSNTVRNLQLLCETCNRQKSNKIG